MANAELSMPAGSRLGYAIEVAAGQLELSLDGTVIARVDRPGSDGDRWHIADLAPGLHRLDLTARNLGSERYNGEVRLWVGDAGSPSWKTIFTYRSSRKPSDTGAGHSVMIRVGTA
jgi:hypothetical protein